MVLSSAIADAADPRDRRGLEVLPRLLEAAPGLAIVVIIIFALVVI